MNIEIANRLVELRKKNGLSQEELAEKLGLSRQAVSKWERAEASPDTDNLLLLSRIYGVSLDELLSTEQSSEEIKESIKDKEDDDDGIEKKVFLHKASKAEKTSWFVGSLLLPLGLIAYIIIGLLWKDENMGWRFGWTFILHAVWLSTIVPAIMHKRITDFAYPIFVVSTYCTLGFLGDYFGFAGWSVYWFLFITIPVFYVAGYHIQSIWRKK